ncbi:acyl-CoA-binding domain-containing protein 5-like isoform X1 [Argiope bruennichi]|uniref:acyl-CoA-binding domain-containing protein 5-like isoform X1 n=2 Tax=Argiope bruennichi TaxID=94029 RepID=UPI0024954BF4|nr:acyl-CoA-binding domain-containing protein 5-like isoform X1 [Argiope bruennichi]
MSLQEKFFAAVDVINSIPYDGTFEPSQEMMLKLHALEKQATEGPCYIPKPYIWNTSARAKWNTWYNLGDMSQETAMKNYIDELTKVIETMSYNEKIAKFVSLMGPFFEEVIPSTEEKGKWSENSISSTVLENYNPPTISELYHMSKIGKDDRYSHSESNRFDLPQNFEFLDSHPENSSDSLSTTSSEISNFDILSDLSDYESPETTERTAFNRLKNPKVARDCAVFNDKYFLMLALMNLQKSMEGILKKLDNLNILAESTNLENLETINNRLDYGEWSLNSAGTVFALVWPFVVDLCFHVLRNK